jgi:hypothetical protein
MWVTFSMGIGMEKALFGLPMVCGLSLGVIVSRYLDDSFGWDSLPLSGPRECPFAFFFCALGATPVVQRKAVFYESDHSC